MKTWIIRAAALAVACAAGTEVHAYTWKKCDGKKAKQKSADVTLHASTNSFPANSTWHTALAWVAERWNESASNMEYVMEANPGGLGTDNGESEVWWSDDIDPWAVTVRILKKSTCKILEADVIFNSDIPYTTSADKTKLAPYGGSKHSFRAVAMHELGHVQGLNHTTNTYSVMGDASTYLHTHDGLATAYPGEDALDGSIDTYGTKETGSWEDLAVVHWRYTGSDGEYSEHARTRVFNLSNNLLAKDIVDGEPVYRVNAGQTIQWELTFENMGETSFLTVNARYYLSTNPAITASDTVLKTGTIGVGRDAPATAKITLALPQWIESGTTYYLGAWLDYDSQLSEYNGGNNRTYTAIRVN